jgi:hypothetical protein
MKNRKFNFLASLLPVFALALPVMAAQEKNPNVELLETSKLVSVKNYISPIKKGTIPGKEELEALVEMNDAIKYYLDNTLETRKPKNRDNPKNPNDPNAPSASYLFFKAFDMLRATFWMKEIYTRMVKLDPINENSYLKEKSKADESYEDLLDYTLHDFNEAPYQDLKKNPQIHKKTAEFFAEISNTMEKKDKLYIEAIDLAINLFESLKRNQLPSYINPAQKNRLHQKAIEWYSNKLNQLEALDQTDQNPKQNKQKINRYRIRLDELNKNLNAPN